MEVLKRIMEQETAGDPVRGCKWTRKTTGKISRLLQRIGIEVGERTVARLLKQMDFSLRVNLKSLESGLKNPPDPTVRDRQFRYIKRQWKEHEVKGLPVISVDTKSRELIGPFHQPGRVWADKPIHVLDHDFPSDAQGVGIPYGIYDVVNNKGFVSVGTSCDTAEFAVDSIRSWWLHCGQLQYPEAEEILILADCGGSNGYRTRLWKHQLQKVISDPFGLIIKVCHYPPGSSKWNPVEHRMFCFIGNNWGGIPLRSHETMLKYIRTAKTATGLRLMARLNKKKYLKGKKISDAQMRELNVKRDSVHPDWNYAIAPTGM